MDTEALRPLWFTCPECRVGALREASAFYCAWVDNRFITIPDFPAWTCDVCGRREYDQAALQDLKALLRLEPRPRRSPAEGSSQAGDVQSRLGAGEPGPRS